MRIHLNHQIIPPQINLRILRR